MMELGAVALVLLAVACCVGIPVVIIVAARFRR